MNTDEFESDVLPGQHNQTDTWNSAAEGIRWQALPQRDHQDLSFLREHPETCQCETNPKPLEWINKNSFHLENLQDITNVSVKQGQENNPSFPNLFGIGILSRRLEIKKHTHEDLPLPVGPKIAFKPGLMIPLREK